MPALSPGSGTGVSDTTEVSAEAVPGKEEAKERTVERTASGDSCVGGSEGAGAWKRDGWVRSAGVG